MAWILQIPLFTVFWGFPNTQKVVTAARKVSFLRPYYVPQRPGKRNPGPERSVPQMQGDKGKTTDQTHFACVHVGSLRSAGTPSAQMSPGIVFTLVGLFAQINSRHSREQWTESREPNRITFCNDLFKGPSPIRANEAQTLKRTIFLRSNSRERMRANWNQELSKYGSVYSSKWWKSQFSVDSQLRTQLTKQPPQSSSKGNFFVRVLFGGLPSTVEEVVRVRFCCLPSWETNTRNTSQTVLGHRPKKRFAFAQEKKKHININKFAGLSRDWVGAKNLFMCFFRVIPYGGGKTHKQNSPQNHGTVPWKFCLRVFFFMCLFRSLFANRSSTKVFTWSSSSSMRMKRQRLAASSLQHAVTLHPASRVSQPYLWNSFLLAIVRSCSGKPNQAKADARVGLRKRSIFSTGH